tara:strand:- start:672921 stop:673460 length:540 start_codon:yes stop_codon:yes gene_type:complete
MLSAQQNTNALYEASNAYPYGRINPKAPKEVADYAPLIGICDCTSQSRNADQTWAKPVKMTWKFKYIMNGMAVQDETLKEDGKHSGSIRQYSKDSAQWNVHYYASATVPTRLPTWTGNKKEDDIVLYRAQKAPNGLDGFFRLTFFEISTNGFNWVGEWVDKTEKIVFPTWKIQCVKRKT